MCVTVRKLRETPDWKTVSACLVAGGKQSTPGSTVGLRMFSIFTDELDDDTECRNKSEDNTILGLSCWHVKCYLLWRHLQDLASRNHIKFNKMYKVPHLGQGNAICQDRLEMSGWAADFVKRTWRIVDVRSNVSQWCACCKGGKLHIGWLLKKGGHQIKESH